MSCTYIHTYIYIYIYNERVLLTWQEIFGIKRVKNIGLNCSSQKKNIELYLFGVIDFFMHSLERIYVVVYNYNNSIRS